MRLWSLHPSFLDSKGLVACWREALLAQAVLSGNTNGYKHHPQLDRFRGKPGAIQVYLEELWKEADRRGYKFNRELIEPNHHFPRIPVTDNQIIHEWLHLVKKLSKRGARQYLRILGRIPYLHPLFYEIEGSIEQWEKQ